MPLGANAGYKLFTTGDILTAAQVQNNLQNQSIMFFADAAARDASAPLTAALTEGMFCYLADVNQVQFYTGSAWVGLLGGGGASLPTLTSPKETVTVSGTALNGATDLDIITSSVYLYTTVATGNYPLNIRGNASTTLNSLMSNGEQITCVVASPNGANAYYPNTFSIDSTLQTVLYLGSAPVGGNINATDVYVYTIIKRSANTYTVLASQNKFA